MRSTYDLHTTYTRSTYYIHTIYYQHTLHTEYFPFLWTTGITRVNFLVRFTTAKSSTCTSELLLLSGIVGGTANVVDEDGRVDPLPHTPLRVARSVSVYGGSFTLR